MKPEFDMIVIGAGSGGLSMALALHQLKFKVLLIDKSDNAIGGECLNNGCIPSKAFIHATKKIQAAHDAQKFGLQVSGVPDLNKIWHHVTAAQDNIRQHENAAYFDKIGLQVAFGTARFAGQNQVLVDGIVYSGKKITIATGSKPIKLKVPGIELVKYYDNENIWDLTEIPERMLLIGAGPINMELGQAFARLGSKVMIVEQMDRIMSKEAKEISDILIDQSRSLGIEFYLKSEVSHFEDHETAVLNADETQLTLKFDVLMVGIGRDISCAALDPQAASISINDRGVLQLDQYLRTTNHNVLAIGDVAGGPQFSHAAEYQASIHVGNLISPFRKKIRYNKFSWVTFTDPEVASFGLTEEDLRRNQTTFEKLELDFSEDDRAVTNNYQFGKLVLFITPGKLPLTNPKLLGGSIIAPNAGEMVQELILAQSSGLGIRSIFEKIYPYPTGGRVNKTAVLNKYIDSIQPWMVKIMKMLY